MLGVELSELEFEAGLAQECRVENVAVKVTDVGSWSSGRVKHKEWEPRLDLGEDVPVAE